MAPLILDVETYALDDAAQFIEEPTPPANYKNPDVIAAYIEKAKADALKRCALDVDLCRLVCIGLDLPQGIVTEVIKTEREERDGLRYVWSFVGTIYEQLLGFNILGFDLPVLIRRSQYLGVRVPPLNLDRYRTPHIDLMERLTFNGKLKARGLNFYCKRFGVDVPDDISGQDIDALVKAGDWEAVANHCRADILKTKALAERIGVLQLAGEVGVF